MGVTEFQTQYHAAGALCREGRFGEALAILDELDRALPNNRDIMWARAICFKGLARTDEASEICDTLIALFGDERAIQLKQQLVQPDDLFAPATPTAPTTSPPSSGSPTSSTSTSSSTTARRAT